MDEAAALVLPSSNRGVSETERVGVVIDWVAAAFDLTAALDSRGVLDNEREILDDLNGTGNCAAMVAETLAGLLFPGLYELGDVTRGRFYNWRVSLRAGGEHVGLLEFGGLNTVRQDGTYTARMELTGDGCRIYETASSGDDHAQRWSSLASLLGALDARLTRVDIAADDFAGTHPVHWAIDRYNDGDFDRRGQRPKARLIDDMGNRTGKTFYVGSRKSEKQLRVYEKGREQGKPDSEWVRYEGQFSASNRCELSLLMLTDPAPYLVGAYPVLEFIGGVGERLRIATEKLLANAERAVRHFRRQYGPMVNALLHAAGGDEATLSRLIIGTARNKLPAWCSRPEDAAHLLSVILFAPTGEIKADSCTP